MTLAHCFTIKKNLSLCGKEEIPCQSTVAIKFVDEICPRSKTFASTNSCEDEFAGRSNASTSTTATTTAAAETSSPSLTRRKLSFRNRWRSRKNIGDDSGGTVLRRSQSAKEVRGICQADSLSIRSPADLSSPSNVENSFSEKSDPKKDDSTTNLFRTFRLKRTRTLSSIVATWNKSIRINKRKSQSFRHLENFFTPFEQRYSSCGLHLKFDFNTINKVFEITVNDVL